MAGIMMSASTGAMNSLLGKLATLMEEEFAKLKNLRKEVKSMSDELRSMNGFLERLADLDELDPQTKGWKDDVREMSYDIEDIIDDFKQNIGEKNENSGIVNKTIERLKTLMARHCIASRIKEIKKLVHETSERQRRYKFDIPASNDVAIDTRVVALYEKAADLVGMEGPADELVNRLKDDQKQLKVVSIVGFGGLGKTTLANQVYGKIKGEFDCCAFVPVSQKPNIPKLLGSLLSEFGIEPSIHACESHLIDKLRGHLQAKRYLIIIDDIWDVQAWGVIKCAFPENDLGSRIIATTRIQSVAKACCSHLCDYTLNMKPLSNEDSRRLFFGRIFGSEEACPGHLRDVSVGILKKCGGLPLAIISISSLLAVEGFSRKERWEHVRNSLGSMSQTILTLEGMRQILNLSYKNLPRHLKTCFMYLGMYPEDYEISRDYLELQWIAEGFVSKEYGGDVKRAAASYFNELVNRSLVQPVQFDSIGSVLSCRVHDMMLDLILCKSAEENFFSVVDGPDAIPRMPHNARRLSVCWDGRKDGTILPWNISMTQVRSLMIFGDCQNIPPMSEFKFLRVLYFVSTHRSIDLTGLCKLHQLRYLHIDGWVELPTQIRGLQQLATLYIHYSCKMPSDIAHLTSLLHLDVGMFNIPNGIGNLKSLQYLSEFDWSDSLDNIMGLLELTNLRNLTLTDRCSSCTTKKKESKDIILSSLGKLCSLEYLHLYHGGGCMDSLWALSTPPRYLEKLHMDDHNWFSRVPNWMGELHNIRQMDLTVNELLKDGVGILGELPSLIDLKLWIKRRAAERIAVYGRAFSVLKRFSLCWSRTSYLTFQPGAMPKLKRLELNFNFRYPEDRPAGIEHLSSLEVVSPFMYCYDYSESTKRSAESAMRSVVNIHPNHPRIESNPAIRSCSFADD